MTYAEPGDLVECMTSEYQSVRLRRGTVHTVLGVDNTCYILNNPASSHWDERYGCYTSRFKKSNFRLVTTTVMVQGAGGGGGSYQHKEKTYMHIAVCIDYPGAPDTYHGTMLGKVQDGLNRGKFITSDSQSELKERVKDAISRDVNQKWVIFSGNTVAEMAAPPIRFRQL